MRKLIEGGKTVTETEIQAVLKSDGTKSGKMKALFDLGLEVKEITAIMSKHDGKEMRYNFVYNVVSNYCNMNGIQTVASEKARGQVRDQIVALYLAGKSNKEISIELKTNANYVFNVLKAYKKQHGVAEEVPQEEAAQ